MSSRKTTSPKRARSPTRKATSPKGHRSPKRSPVRSPKARSASILEIINRNPQFTTLAKLVAASNLTSTLNGVKVLTVFAPTDAAFSKLTPCGLKALLNDPVRLRQILLYHVVPGNFSAERLAKTKEVKTSASTKIAGKRGVMRMGRLPISLKQENGNIFANNAKITEPNIVARKGRIHAIDTVLVPPIAQQVVTKIIPAKQQKVVTTTVAVVPGPEQHSEPIPIQVEAPVCAREQQMQERRVHSPTFWPFF